MQIMHGPVCVRSASRYTPGGQLVILCAAARTIYITLCVALRIQIRHFHTKPEVRHEEGEAGGDLSKLIAS